MEITKDVQAVINEAELMSCKFSEYVVESNESLIIADTDLSKIKEKLKDLEERRKEITKPLDIAKASAMELFRKPIELLTTARERINMAMSAYKREQERIRQEQERKLQEMARKEEDRKRKILEERAAKAEASGKAEKAEELRAKAEEVFIPAPIVQSTVVETKNKPRQVWKYRVVDEKLVPREYLTIDDLKVGQVARATKGSLSIPGIEIFSEESRY